MSSYKIDPRELTCFAVYKATKIPSFIGDDMWIVKFSSRNIEDPDSDLIGLHFYNGTRRYIWREKTWIEYTIFWMAAETRIKKELETCRTEQYLEFQELLGDLSACSMSFTYPMPGGSNDSNTNFIRLLKLSQ